MPEIGIDENLTAVAAIAPDDIWVSGSYAMVDANNQLVYLPLFLHWNGSQWLQFDSPGFGRDLVAIESNNVYAVGGETLVHWDGQSWTVAGGLDINAEASLNAIDNVPGTGDLVTAGWQGFPQDTLIARFIPSLPDAVPVSADSFEITRGQFISGTVADLAKSDNSKVLGRRETSDTSSNVYVEVRGTSPTPAPTSLEFTLEASVFARSEVIQSIDVYDFNIGAWEELDSRIAARLTDSTVTVSAKGDLSRFVEAETGQLEARCRFQSINPRQQFSASIDQTLWMIRQ